MRQSQAEIKAIEAELRAIRADKPLPPRAFSQASDQASDQASGHRVTLLDFSYQSDDADCDSSAVSSNTVHLGSANLEAALSSTEMIPAIAPTIVRQSTARQSPVRQPTVRQPPVRQSEPANTAANNTAAKPTANSSATKQKRSVECFPLPRQSISAARSPSTPHVQRRAVKQFKQVQSQFLQEHSRHQQEAIRDLLAEKAQQINHLSTQQETMILELLKISEQLEQNPQTKRQSEPVCEYLAAEVPYVDQRSGRLVITTRPVEPLDTENEAVSVAQSLRHRARKRHSVLTWVAMQIWHLVGGITRLGMTLSIMLLNLATAPVRLLFYLLIGRPTSQPESVAQPRRRYRGSGRKAATPFTLKSALLLVAGSALLRVLLDWIVISHPSLWIPSILVMITPAMFAIYRATVTPQTGFAWGYRLFAIMIGLLLGGRL